MKFLYTSESVSGGHPDKLCDYVSDSVLDACLAVDPNARVACETAVKGNMVMILGEITCNGEVNFEQVVRRACKEIGYDDWDKGFDYKNAQVIIHIDKQSTEIANSVHVDKDVDSIGAGDQGLMLGYATNECPELMPLTFVLSTKILKVMDDFRRDGTIAWLRPDMKSQVTIEYSKDDKGSIKPLWVHTVLISAQHDADVTNQEIREQLLELVIKKVIPAELLTENTKYVINPSNSFVIGGPRTDAGLTGRKIIADTYGGWGGHGGNILALN